VCLSTQQAEYYALSEGTKEAFNLRFLLRDLGFGQSLPTTLFCDNEGAITMRLHLDNKPASRHFDMRIHFCRQHIEFGDVSTSFTSTPDMVADFMAKRTQRLTHERHCRRVFGSQRPHYSRTHFVYIYPPLSLAFLLLLFFQTCSFEGGDTYTPNLQAT
jgi:hypothetical protein